MDATLIDRVYEAAVVPELWPSVLDDLAVLTDAKGGLLFSVRGKVLSWTATDNLQDVFASYVSDGWFRRCGRRICLFDKAHSAFMREQDYWTEEELETNEIYRDFFRPRDLGWSAGTGLAIPTGDNIVFSVERAFSSGPMERGNVEFLNEIRPHLARSAMIAARLGLKSATSAKETFEKLGVPTILLNAAGMALETGNLTEEIFEHVVWGAENRLSFKDVHALALFQSSMEALSAKAQAVQSFPVRDEQNRPVLVAHLIPINRSAYDIFAQGYALLVLLPVAAKTAPPADLVRSLFDLTASEAEVARCLVRGRSVEEIAMERGVSHNTVRTHLRKVLEKTGTSRQAELVALLTGITVQR